MGKQKKIIAGRVHKGFGITRKVNKLKVNVIVSFDNRPVKQVWHRPNKLANRRGRPSSLWPMEEVYYVYITGRSV